MSASTVRTEYASLLSNTLPSVIRSEAENGRQVAMLEELDRKGNRMSAAERRMAELLTLLIENFEEKIVMEPFRASGIFDPRTRGDHDILADLLRHECHA